MDTTFANLSPITHLPGEPKLPPPCEATVVMRKSPTARRCLIFSDVLSEAVYESPEFLRGTCSPPRRAMVQLFVDPNIRCVIIQNGTVISKTKAECSHTKKRKWETCLE
jgi:hypothetical protein